jgi:hypothetical protein
VANIGNVSMPTLESVSRPANGVELTFSFDFPFPNPELFEKIYGNYNLSKNKHIQMIQGVAKLAGELTNAAPADLTFYLKKYLGMLSEFLRGQRATNLYMWQRQLFFAIVQS